MSQRNGLLVALLVLVLVVAACGPDMVTPTASVLDATETSPTMVAATEQIPEAGPVPGDEGDPATAEPAEPVELPVAADDWHILGSPDAPVTIFEYSDFQ
jgi:protein-disulfide isomerase